MGSCLRTVPISYDGGEKRSVFTSRRKFNNVQGFLRQFEILLMVSIRLAFRMKVIVMPGCSFKRRHFGNIELKCTGYEKEI